MFATVLLPTDFSPDAQRILPYLRDIPGVRRAVLLHIVDATRPSRRGWEHGPHIENAKILIEENRQKLAAAGIAAETIVETIIDTITQGDIPRAIVDTAEAWNASLIVMGARGMNTIPGILLGSVPASVIRHARVPVLLMRFPRESCPGDERTGLFSRVLVPVDFSKPAQDALALAKTLPVTGQLILLHVVDRGESEAEIQAAVANARNRLGAMETELAGAGLPVRALIHVGYPPDEITATAEREDVSLILMSPQGEGWTREIRSLFLGSTTDAVTRQARRPVLVTAGRKPA